MITSKRLWSLWAIMEKFYVSAFFTALNGVANMLRQLANGADYPTMFVHAHIDAMHASCNNLNLAVACNELTKAKHIFDGVWGPNKRPELAEHANRLLDAVSVELKTQNFMRLSPEEVSYLFPDNPLFGKDVQDKLPALAGEDISEAGACIGHGRYTASVFHLMRVMEICVQKFGDVLGVALIDKNGKEKMWHNILEQSWKAIGKLDPVFIRIFPALKLYGATKQCIRKRHIRKNKQKKF